MHNAQSPDMSDAGLEPRLQASAVAPRVTLADLDAAIVSRQFLRPEGTTLTICVLTLRNGFTVTGESAAASPENFNEKIGQDIAYENARQKLWPLLGYALKERLKAIQDLARRLDDAASDEPEQLFVESIARMAHEVNRAYCRSLGDESQPTWETAPQWQQDSARNGVRMHLKNPAATPEDSHASWLAEKEAAGWKWGAVKDPEKKEHPCFLPYAQLPQDQKAKDWLFRGVVHAMMDLP